jgi:hypothetical protein
LKITRLQEDLGCALRTGMAGGDARLSVFALSPFPTYGLELTPALQLSSLLSMKYMIDLSL